VRGPENVHHALQVFLFNSGGGLMKNISLMIMCAMLALGTQVAMAGSMLCGGSAIEDGELEPVSEEQVLAACGEPTSKDEFGQWEYARPGEVVKTLRFDSDGNLQSISTQMDDD
jgi:hypothetical protein